MNLGFNHVKHLWWDKLECKLQPASCSVVAVHVLALLHFSCREKVFLLLGWESARGRYCTSRNASHALPCLIYAELLKLPYSSEQSRGSGLRVEFQRLKVGMGMCRYCCFLMLNVILLLNRLIHKTIGQLHTAASCPPGTDKSWWWISTSLIPRKLLSFCLRDCCCCCFSACGASFTLLTWPWQGLKLLWAALLGIVWWLVYLRTGSVLKRFCNQQNTCHIKTGLVFSVFRYFKLKLKGLFLL